MEGRSVVAHKVMVMADPTQESASALQFALSHAVVENDTLIIFHVGNLNAWKNHFGVFFRKPNANCGGGAGATTSMPLAVEGGRGVVVDFLDAMNQACVTAQPKVKVVVEKAEMADGKVKAAVILAQSAVHKIDLLIIGQRRSLSNAILG